MRGLLLAAGLAAAPLSSLCAQALPTVEVAVLARSVDQGEILTTDDFAEAGLPATIARGALSANAASGKEAVRALMAGAPVKSYDVVAPRLVRKGEAVVLLVASGALRIEGQGKALSTGAKGDVVKAQLRTGGAIIEGTVTAPGIIEVGSN